MTYKEYDITATLKYIHKIAIKVVILTLSNVLVRARHQQINVTERDCKYYKTIGG